MVRLPSADILLDVLLPLQGLANPLSAQFVGNTSKIFLYRKIFIS
jgi:hypothetical protein